MLVNILVVEMCTHNISAHNNNPQNTMKRRKKLSEKQNLDTTYVSRNENKILYQFDNIISVLLCSIKDKYL